MTIAGFSMVLVWQPDEKSPAASLSSASASGEARYGPGLWTAAAAPTGHGGMTLQPPVHPNTTADGRLVIDQTLHQVIDYFLLSGQPGDRTLHAAQLRAYLRNALPPVAAQEALQIVDRYLLYMNLHDDLLARQALPQWVDLPSAAEADRIANWVIQRTRLRQTVLGREIMQAWYAEEEETIRAGLAEFEAQNDAVIASHGGKQADESEVRASRKQDADHEIRREQFFRRLADQSSRSYAALEHRLQVEASRRRNPAH
ncbi:MAG TPA: hypothetical protein VEC06_12645 [Paucimonas sp.]|nr:hypothetical protein [Paucimonas sp.]